MGKKYKLGTEQHTAMHISLLLIFLASAVTATAPYTSEQGTTCARGIGAGTYSTENGAITVYCIHSRTQVDWMIFLQLPAMGLSDSLRQLTGLWNKSLTYFNDDSYLSVCLLNCSRGKPYPRFRRLNSAGIMEPNRVNVGCDDHWNMMCKHACPTSALNVSNGRVICTEGEFAGSICIVQCDEGYRSRRAITKSCYRYQNLAQWLPPTPFQCEEECPASMVEVEHGSVVCSDGTFVNSVCLLSCNVGYEVDGTRIMRCQSGGWSSSAPFACRALTCDTLPTVRNGEVDCTSGRTYLSGCSLTCDSGYEAMGPEQLWCLQDEVTRHVSWYWFNRDHVPRSASQEESMNCRALPHNRTLAELLIFLSTQGQSIFNTSTLNATVETTRFDLCNVAPHTRRRCGSLRETRRSCEQRLCCYDDSSYIAFSCFQPTESPVNQGDKRPRTTPRGQAARNPTEAPVSSRPTSYFQPYGTHTGNSNFGSPPLRNALSSLLPFLHPLHGNNQCGCRASESPTSVLGISKRVICGQDTSALHWPWHALIEFNRQLCGGTLIAPQYVVTAAHCLLPSSGEYDLIGANYVGVGITNKSRHEENSQVRRVAMVRRHPNFTLAGAGYARNDIAIIKLDRPVDITGPYVRPLCLPRTRPTATDECYITGFGRISSVGSTADILQQGNVSLVRMLDCQRRYLNYVVPGQNICAQGRNQHCPADTCKGDSGGPLVCRKRNPDIGECPWHLSGITSFGQVPCGQPGVPSVYVDVVSYYWWIYSTVGQMEITFSSGRR